MSSTQLFLNFNLFIQRLQQCPSLSCSGLKQRTPPLSKANLNICPTVLRLWSIRSNVRREQQTASSESLFLKYKFLSSRGRSAASLSAVETIQEYPVFCSFTFVQIQLFSLYSWMLLWCIRAFNVLYVRIYLTVFFTLFVLATFSFLSLL